MKQILKRIKNLRQKRIIGLDIDEDSFVATELVFKGKQIYLARYAILSNLAELIKGSFLRDAGLIINIPTQVILFRAFHIAPSFLQNSRNKQKDIIAFLMRQNLPFKLEECFWDTFTLNTELNLIAAKKEAVTKYIAQFEDAGLSVVGITPPLIALYNVLINSEPEIANERFAILNIRISSSDLLFYEAKRLWAYPLPIGKRNLKLDPDIIEKFSQEVLEKFNSHYLQNPSTLQKAKSYFYLSGQESLEALISSLKKGLADFEVKVLAPLKNINIISKEVPGRPETMSLSLGLGLTYLGRAPGLKINLIKGKVKLAQKLEYLDFLKKASLCFLSFTTACLLLWNIKLIQRLRAQVSVYKNTQFQISSMLPQVKKLKEEKAKLENLEGFLERKLHQQSLYLRALAAISESKPAFITIGEFESQMKGAALEVVLSGNAPSYQEINALLSELKKKEGLKGAKVVASTFSTLETEVKEIDFKLRFEIPYDDVISTK